MDDGAHSKEELFFSLRGITKALQVQKLILQLRKEVQFHLK